LNVSFIGALNLAEAELGADMTVTAVAGARTFRRRLLELGVVPGVVISVRKVAPLGDPLELRIRGCNLSIRKTDAAAIEVEPA
jgi:Fe2+ transport system protein FeoA